MDVLSLSEHLNSLADEIRSINKANGWNVIQPENYLDTHRIPAILALIHSEVSEALEGWRKRDDANFREELADILIRLLDLSGGLSIDLAAEVAKKLEKNRARGYRHGGKLV